MARRKNDNEKYNDRLYLRCMSDQKSCIKTKAKDAGFDNTNSYVLEMALHGNVVVNDNSMSFYEYALIHKFREVGTWLDKILHRANIIFSLPDGLDACLQEVNHLLNYVSFTLKFYDGYIDDLPSLKEDQKTKKDEWKAKLPVAIPPKLAFQLFRLGNNLMQFHRIAEQQNIYPHELAVCRDKAEVLLNRIS